MLFTTCLKSWFNFYKYLLGFCCFPACGLSPYHRSVAGLATPLDLHPLTEHG